MSEVIIKEKYGTQGKFYHYSCDESTCLQIHLDEVQTSTASSAHLAGLSFSQNLVNFFGQVFLPNGFPDSVSDDYSVYQLWDTIQAFCSTITGTLSTRAVLKGIGVGSAEATPLAAAITWILRDGTGMIARILFAWWKGNDMDFDCKKWRLFADFINDCALFADLLVPYVSRYSTPLLCLTTTMRSVVGVAGGATRATITQHQAVRGNAADVAAKDGSQETFVNLCAYVVSLYLLTNFGEGEFEWGTFMFFTAIHLFANYMAVKSLVMRTFNISRMILVLQCYLKHDVVPTPESINYKESVILGLGRTEMELCGFNIKLGSSFKNVVKGLRKKGFDSVKELYKESSYILLPRLRKRTMYVLFLPEISTSEVLVSYFHAVMLAISTCYYNRMPTKIEPRPFLHESHPLMRLHMHITPADKDDTAILKNIPFQMMARVAAFSVEESERFFEMARKAGWKTDRHSMPVDEWRVQWAKVE